MTKLLRIGLLILIGVIPALGEFNAKEFLQDWQTRRGATWGELQNLTASERAEVIRVLNFEEVHSDEAGKEHLSRIRFILRDPEAIDQVTERFRRASLSKAGSIDLPVVESSNDPEVIGKIADLLWREEGGFEGSDTGMPNAAYSSAFVIPRIATKVMEFDPKVRVWADSLVSGGADLVLVSLRNWWKENELAFKEKRYGDVKPGAAVPNRSSAITASNAKSALPSAESTDVHDRSPQPDQTVRPEEKPITNPESSSPWVFWSAGVIALVFAIGAILFRSRRKVTGG